MSKSVTELVFVLEVDDGWPPVAKECMPCTDLGSGYRIEVPPLFVKELSVGDVISVERNDDGEVVAWSHVEKSMRSTVWVMVTSDYSIEDAIECFKKLKCSVAEFEPYRYFAIDVPEECPVECLDGCLDDLDDNHISIAYPSFRH